MSTSQYIQFGCGWSAPTEWRNFDASLTLRFERVPIIGRMYKKNASRFPEAVEYGDIVRGLPVSASSCEAVYCSHVLEHLSLNDFRLALLNTKKIMRAGGIFRLVLPDLEYLAKRYIENTGNEAALDFMRETSLGRESRSRNLKGFIMTWLGNSQHLWMWDYKSISAELVKVGFDAVRRARYGDSTDPMFGKVEEVARWEHCLGIECRKPG